MIFLLQRWKSLIGLFNGRISVSALSVTKRVELFQMIRGSLFFVTPARTFGLYRVRSTIQELVLISLEA